jgi:hypothetical protein
VDDKIYQEIGENYRFFAKWRQLAFAGYLAVLAAAMSFLNSAVEHQYSRCLVGFCFFLAAAIGVIFWIADRRTTELAFYAIEAGKSLEAGKAGFFTVTLKRDAERSTCQKFFNHSRAAGVLYLGPAILGFVALLVTAFWPCAIGLHNGTKVETVWEYKIIAFEGSVTNGETQVNQLARDGWMVVSHSTSPESAPAPHSSVILGRPKEERDR